MTLSSELSNAYKLQDQAFKCLKDFEKYYGLSNNNPKQLRIFMKLGDRFRRRSIESDRIEDIEYNS